MQIRFAVLALVAAVLALPAVASAEKLKIRLTSVQTLQLVKDSLPRGKTNKGDVIEFKDLMRNEVRQFGKAKNAPVAFDAGTVTYTNATRRVLKCRVNFPGIGTLTYGGRLVDRSDNTASFPIMSGTGGFKHATGTVTFLETQTKKPSNVFDVVVPGNPIDMTSSSVS
jgi:hypothetical protein